ncbi:TetR/AcrR family transcriptional regulator [Variovorax soli]|uniref:TetR/AcrR family transcriptional regulator n=1 Tax=Variovorax soli TaxID=376815 RepID=UPI000838B7A7|nr:TetR/AcrR family transcriptional regulator [Variovorax soli]
MTARKQKEPEINRDGLLKAAAAEFASRGLQGARLEAIAAEARITRAMIYYYFGGRDGLYLATLEESYRRIREAEAAIDLRGLDPVESMRKITRFRIDYYVQNPSLVALVAIENQNQASYIKGSREIRSQAGASLDALQSVLRQGQEAKVFRTGIDIVELHQLMVSMGMFNVANQHTFGAVFSRNMTSPRRLKRTRDWACEVVLRFLAA